MDNSTLKIDIEIVRLDEALDLIWKLEEKTRDPEIRYIACLLDDALSDLKFEYDKSKPADLSYNKFYPINKS